MLSVGSGSEDIPMTGFIHLLMLLLCCYHTRGIIDNYNQHGFTISKLVSYSTLFI